MAIAIWLKTKDSRAILRSFEGKKQIVVVHAYRSWIGAQEGYHLVVLVVRNRFLQLALRRRLWGLTGTCLQTIVGRSDSRAILLRKSWADLGRELKAIKARGRS